jgi:hypothetical protein
MTRVWDHIRKEFSANTVVNLGLVYTHHRPIQALALGSIWLGGTASMFDLRVAFRIDSRQKSHGSGTV